MKKQPSNPTKEQIKKEVDTYLDLIVIRAQIKGQWGSYTLKELWELGDEGRRQIRHWMLERIYRHMGYVEGTEITKENIVAALITMEDAGITIVKLKK